MSNPWPQLPKIIALNHRSRKAMESYQEHRLIRLVRDVYKGNEFYRRLWDEAGFSPERFKGREDLSMIPLVTKQQVRPLMQTLREMPPAGMRLVWHKTSGTSGEPLNVARSWHEERFLTVIKKLSLRRLGFRARFRQARIQVPPDFDWLSDTPLRMLNQLGCYRSRVFSCFDEPDMVWKQLSEYQPDSITGYAESVARIARYGLDSGLHDVQPKLIGVGGEMCTPLMRSQISEAFRVPVYQSYAATEVNMIAWNCSDSDLLHICDPMVLIEILDKGEKPVGEGERGQVVVTALHSRTMPLCPICTGRSGGQGSNSLFLRGALQYSEVD